MRRVLPLFAGLLMAAGLLPRADAQPFPRREAFTFSLPTLGLLFADSAAVHKELALSPEQADQLKALQIRWFTDYSKLRPSEMKDRAAALSQAAEKGLADVLDAKQRTRLEQLTLQYYEAGYGAGVTALPEVADALKLENRPRAFGGPAGDLKKALTAEQYTAWEKLRGPEFKEKLTASFGGQPTPLPGIPSFPTFLHMAAQKSVRAELKATAEEEKKLAAAADAYLEFLKEFADLPAADQAKAREAKARETEQAVAAALDAGKLKRLRQIVYQLGIFQSGSDPVAAALLYERSPLGEQLGIDARQRQAARPLVREHFEAERKIVLSGKPAAEIEADLKALDESTRARCRGLLTADQKRQLPGLFGEPFTGAVRAIAPLRNPFTAGPAFFPGLPTVPLFVGSYAASLFAGQASVQQELKATPEQVEKARALAEEQVRSAAETRRANAGDADKMAQALGDLNAETEKKLAGLLGADKVRRLKQIAIQVLTTPPEAGLGRPFLTPLTAYAEIAGPLKLTAEQKARLNDGEALAGLLTPEQKATLKALTGEPFAGKIETRSLFGERNSALALLRREGVAAALKLSDDQQARLRELSGERLTEARAEEAVRDLLQPEQLKRFEQIRRQQQSAGTALAAFLARDKVAREVALGDDDVARLKALAAETAAVVALLNRPAVLPRFQAEVPQPAPDFNRQQRERMLAVLNPKQQTLLKNLLGEPVEGLDADLFGPRGGFGGPRLPVGFSIR